MTVVHPIEPVYNSESKILILGSFPSVKSREVGFYYGHKQNRFWKVIASVLNPDDAKDKELVSNWTVEDKKLFLLKNKIAVWDVIHSCTISGSSDSSITDVVVNDITRILKESDIQTIYINGKKAYELYEKYIYDLVVKKYGRLANAVCLPSTSPANAACKEEALINAWGRIRIGLNKSSAEKIYSLNSYANDNYGKKLYKLSLDGGFTCPNRDGSVGFGGCIFCAGDGSGYFGGKRIDSISKQLENQKGLIAPKLPKNKKVGYIAYFQAFTGTYGEVDRLKKLYMEAAADPEVEIISIATRPDCLNDDVLMLLHEIMQIKQVWIELGLQTIHSRTAKYIRRGYELKVYDKAVKKLQLLGVQQIITHVIIGLPNESKKDILDTVKYVAKSESNGIKLQLLHVLKDTDLEKDYEAGKFETLTIEEYIDILHDSIQLLPPDMVIHRLTGDGAKANLIAPLWSADKKNVMNQINKALG